MRPTITYFILILLFTHTVYSQKVVKKPSRVSTQNTAAKSINSYSKYRTLGIGFGVTRSVVYLARNVKESNDATGLNASLVYNVSNMVRMSLEYTKYFPIDIAPTWYDIKANTIELNTHVIARLSRSDAYFYPLFGISYNTFTGFYTGINDYLNLSTLYKKNEQVLTTWFGLNLGTGYEYFFKPGSFFIDYKMRIGFTEGTNQINIQDVCISAGLRLNLRVRSLKNIFIYRDTRSRYSLEKADNY